MTVVQAVVAISGLYAIVGIVWAVAWWMVESEREHTKVYEMMLKRDDEAMWKIGK